MGWTAIVGGIIVTVGAVYGQARWPPGRAATGTVNLPVRACGPGADRAWWLVSARQVTGPGAGPEEELRGSSGSCPPSGRGTRRAARPHAGGEAHQRALPDTVLAIDQGTSATKALVVGPDGEVLGEAEAAVHPGRWTAGASSRTPRSSGGRSSTRAPPPCERPRSPSSGRAREPGRDGARLGPNHRCAGHAGARLAGPPRGDGVRAPPRTSRRASPPSPGSSSTRTSWRRRSPGSANTSPVTGSPRQPMPGCSTGCAARSSPTPPPRPARCSSTSTASPGRRRRPELFGVEDDELPEIVTCAQPVGSTTTFGPEVPVVGLAVDQQAALFAEACLAAGEAKCTFGTGAFLLATTGAAARRSQSRSRRVRRVAASRRGGGPPETTYCLDGQVYTVGAALRWLTEVGVITEAGRPRRDRRAGGRDGRATFVPGLAGLAAPFWEPNARGALHRPLARDDARPSWCAR